MCNLSEVTRWQLEIALILYFLPSAQAFPSILESREDMSFEGSVFPLLRFGYSKATEATLYLWRAHSSIWDSCTWRWVCDCVVLVQQQGEWEVSLEHQAQSEGSALGGRCWCFLPKKGSVLIVWAHWWTPQGDLKLSHAVWNILTSLIPLLEGLIAAVRGLLFFLFPSWFVHSLGKTGQSRGEELYCNDFYTWLAESDSGNGAGHGAHG